MPGCPPRPEALLHGIIRLQEQIAGERLSGRAIAERLGGAGRLVPADGEGAAAPRYTAHRTGSAAEVTRGRVEPPR